MKVHVLRHDGLYRVSNHCQLQHKHPLLSVTYPDFPHDLEEISRDLITDGVDTNHIIEFIHMRTGQLMSRSQIAMLAEPDVRRALGTSTEELLVYMEGRGECRLLTAEMNDEVLRTAIFTITTGERRDSSQFGDVVFIDGTSVRNEFGWTAYHITLADDKKALVSGGLAFTAFEREETFLWLLQILNEILGPKLSSVRMWHTAFAFGIRR